jgi:hypothetical protein
MIADLAVGLGPVAGLAEDDRAIAHLVLALVLLAVAAAVGLVYLIRRVRRRNQTRERQRTPEEY